MVCQSGQGEHSPEDNLTEGPCGALRSLHLGTFSVLSGPGRQLKVDPYFKDTSKDTICSLQSMLLRKQTKLHLLSTVFQQYFPTHEQEIRQYSMKSTFWTNEKLSLMVAWSSSVSISCFKVQSSIGHLVWFFDSGNSIVSGGKSWCPCHFWHVI